MRTVEANVCNDDGQLTAARILIDAGVMREIVSYRHVGESLPTVIPGCIDVHVHGGDGADAMDASPEAFATIACMHARHGTTSLLLTTVTESADAIAAVLTAATSVVADGSGAGGAALGGARVLGVHLEGPFIHPNRAGAQRTDRIIDPQVPLVEEWLGSGVVRMMTLAPERPGAYDVARMASMRGVLVSAGHTDANAQQLADARAAGFRHLTHTCNAMRPLLHRDVGPIGVVVMDESMSADIICDGIHVAPAMVRTLVRSIGYERLLLITDAIRATGHGSGLYELGGQSVMVADGQCRLADGTLAGSVLTMAEAIRHVQDFAGISLAAASRMASRNPAERLGLTRKGRIAVGFDADMALLGLDGEVVATIVGGETVYDQM